MHNMSRSDAARFNRNRRRDHALRRHIFRTQQRNVVDAVQEGTMAPKFFGLFYGGSAPSSACLTVPKHINWQDLTATETSAVKFPKTCLVESSPITFYDLWAYHQP